MSEFGGKVINGEINRYSEGPSVQDEPGVFLDALDRLLAVPGIEAVKWQQYTPYFNDGEACTFRIYSAYVKIAGDEDEEAGDYGDGFRSSYDLYDLDRTNGRWDKIYHQIGVADSKVVSDALAEFESVLENGRHFVILNEKFGDPAEVTATVGGFSVEYYEHD